MNQINLELGERLKEQGMDAAARNRASALYLARLIAKSIAHKQGTVCADDVYARLTPAQIEALGNAGGSIFKGKEWKFHGWTKSKRASNHARNIMVWRLVDG